MGSFYQLTETTGLDIAGQNLLCRLEITRARLSFLYDTEVT